MEVQVLQHCGETYGDYILVLSCNMNASGLDKEWRFVLDVQGIRVQRRSSGSFPVYCIRCPIVRGKIQSAKTRTGTKFFLHLQVWQYYLNKLSVSPC